MATKITIDSTSDKFNTQFDKLKNDFENHTANKDVNAQHLTAAEYFNFKKMIRSKVPLQITPSHVSDEQFFNKPLDINNSIRVINTSYFLSNEQVEEIFDDYCIAHLDGDEAKYEEYKNHIYGIQFPRFEPIYGDSSGVTPLGSDNGGSSVTKSGHYGPALLRGMAEDPLCVADVVSGEEDYETIEQHKGHWSNNKGHFKKLVDNAIDILDGSDNFIEDTTNNVIGHEGHKTRGRKASFVEYMVLDTDDPTKLKQTDQYKAEDEYHNLPFFTDLKCFFVRDINGHRYPTVIEGYDFNVTSSKDPSEVTDSDKIKYDDDGWYVQDVYGNKQYEFRFTPTGYRKVKCANGIWEDNRYDQDVGIISRSYWIKIINTYDAVNYSAADYPKCFSVSGGGTRPDGVTDINGDIIPDGYPVTQIFVSVNGPGVNPKISLTDSNRLDYRNTYGWNICGAAKRYDKDSDSWENMCYVVRCPYMGGLRRFAIPTNTSNPPSANYAYSYNNGPSTEYTDGVNGTNADNKGAMFSARGLYSRNYNSLYRLVAIQQKFKGVGYYGGSIEYYSWMILNLLLKYGLKSSSMLARGSGGESGQRWNASVNNVEGTHATCFKLGSNTYLNNALIGAEIVDGALEGGESIDLKNGVAIKGIEGIAQEREVELLDGETQSEADLRYTRENYTALYCLDFYDGEGNPEEYIHIKNSKMTPGAVVMLTREQRKCGW